MRQHYCFLRREMVQIGDDDEVTKYKQRKQELRVDDLKRFGIQTLLIDDYVEIPCILKEIETRFRKKTVFISGSAEEFGNLYRQEGQTFVHTLTAGLVREGFRVVNGFGWGIGSAVINGALEAIYSNPEKLSEDQLVMRPFPQFASSSQDLQQLWEEYRQRMISLAGIAIFVFGNKLVDGEVVEANGVIREFEIAVQKGVVVIPVGATGYASKTIYETVINAPDEHQMGRTSRSRIVEPDSTQRRVSSKTSTAHQEAEQIRRSLDQFHPYIFTFFNKEHTKWLEELFSRFTIHQTTGEFGTYETVEL